MNSENTKRIIDACPSLFADMGSMRENIVIPISFGFECGDGWADLLVDLCKKIDAHLKTLSKEDAEDIVALQVKEKYGSLRFYVSYSDEIIEGYISEAEKLSSVTCEECGKPGKILGNSWLYCACAEHTRG